MKINPEATIENLGGKGYNLKKLKKVTSVPRFFVMLFDAYDEINQKEVQKEILRTFDKYGFKDVSVRSSATVEDLENASFAGMFESVLNVTKDTVIDAIKTVLNSAKSKRVEDYCKIKNIEYEKVKMRVIIQEMIDSRVSGVCFTKTSEGENIVIEACIGQGESLVSGSVTPDTYFVTRGDMSISKVSIGHQTKCLRKEGYLKVPLNMSNSKKLSDNEIKILAKEAINIERKLNFEAADIEWAYAEDKLYILQARPITTLKKSKADNIIEKIIKAKDYQYYVTRKFNYLVWYTYMVMARDKENQEKAIGFSLKSSNTMVLNGDEYERNVDTDQKMKIFENQLNVDKDFFQKFAEKEKQIVEKTKEYINKLETTNFKDLDKEQILKELDDFRIKYVATCIPGYTRPDDFLEQKVKEAIKRELNIEENKMRELFEKIATCPTERPLKYSEEPLDLLKIAKKIKEDKKTNLDQELITHMKEYAWLKAPVVISNIKFEKEEYLKRLEYLKELDIDKKIEKIMNVRNLNNQNYENVLKENRFSKEALNLIKALRDFIFLRTYTTEYSDNLFYIARNTLLNEIANRCKLKTEDVVMMTFEEMKTILNSNDLKQEVKENLIKRKEAFAILFIDNDISVFFGKEAINLAEEIGAVYKSTKEIKSKNETVIYGTPANKGKIKGVVRILKTYEDIDKVKKDDIIVATMTTPDYVSALEKAKGFITDEGGITCHASIISREFDVPCIVGTVNATEILKDGDQIILDAYIGKITVIKTKK